MSKLSDTHPRLLSLLSNFRGIINALICERSNALLSRQFAFLLQYDDTKSLLDLRTKQVRNRPFLLKAVA